MPASPTTGQLLEVVLLSRHPRVAVRYRRSDPVRIATIDAIQSEMLCDRSTAARTFGRTGVLVRACRYRREPVTRRLTRTELNMVEYRVLKQLLSSPSARQPNSAASKLKAAWLRKDLGEVDLVLEACSSAPGYQQLRIVMAVDSAA